MNRFLDTINPMLGYLIPNFILNGMGIVDPPPGDPPPSTNWRDNLPDDIKSDPIFEKYTEQADAHRALISAQKFLGREKLPVPADENDKDAYDLIYNKLGRPENPEGYVLPTDLEIPKDLPIDETMLGDFRKTAHDLGISPKQFAGIYSWYMSGLTNQHAQYNQQTDDNVKEAETNLRSKWGAAYPQNIALAKKVFNQFADDKSLAEFERTGIGNNPIVLEMFANIGKIMGEDQLQGKPPSMIMTPGEAQVKLNEIKGNMEHPYWVNEHPQHQEAVEEFTRLTKLTLSE